MDLRINGFKKPSLAERALDSNTAVLIVDMQDFFLDGLNIFQINKKIKTQQKCLSYCKESDIPVIALEHTRIEGITIKRLRKYISQVPRRKYIKKNSQDGFTNPELIKYLREWDINNVFLMGVYACSCVLGTAIGARENGLEPRSSLSVVYNPTKHPCFSDWFQKNGSLY